MINKLFVGLLAAALVAPAALAGSGSSLSTYGSPGAKVQERIDTKTTGTLPFTGIDIAVLVAAGLLVLAIGIGFRRLGRDRA